MWCGTAPPSEASGRTAAPANSATRAAADVPGGHPCPHQQPLTLDVGRHARTQGARPAARRAGGAPTNPRRTADVSRLVVPVGGPGMQPSSGPARVTLPTATCATLDAHATQTRPCDVLCCAVPPHAATPSRRQVGARPRAHTPPPPLSQTHARRRCLLTCRHDDRRPFRLCVEALDRGLVHPEPAHTRRGGQEAGDIDVMAPDPGRR